MFQNLSDKFLDSIAKLRKGKITESNIEDVLKDIRMALLEADVNFQVVKKFMDKVKEKAMGEAVLKSVTPDQQFTKIVHDELISVLGGETFFIDLKKHLLKLCLLVFRG